MMNQLLMTQRRIKPLKLWMLVLLVVAILGTTVAWCLNPSAETITPINASLIRVGISDDAMTAQEYPSTTVGATGAFTLKGLKTGTTFAIVEENEPCPQDEHCNKSTQFTVTATATGFTVQPKYQYTGISPSPEYLQLGEGKPIAVTEDIILAVKNPEQAYGYIANITRKGKIPQYRGALQILKSAKSTAQKPLLFVVNVLDINEYLRAVVPNELPIRFGVEAVKAQAVAARNYAVRPREKNWQAFDICDSQYCQAYYGQQTETPETDTLLQATQGLIALSEGQPVLALYSSSHGGVAEAYPNAFSDPKTGAFPAPQNYPYLTVNPDNQTAIIPYQPLSNEANLRAYLKNTTLDSYDVKAPHHRWSRTWTKADLESVLNTTIPQLQANSLTKKFVQVAWKKPAKTSPFLLGSLEKITVSQYGLAGKAMKLQIETSDAVVALQKEFVIRKAFTTQGQALPSATIAFNHLTNTATGLLEGIAVDGAGFGHGVGMSQYGASRMSELGFSFDKIIQHYYPNSVMGTLPLEAKKDVPLQLNFATLSGQKAWLHLQLKQSFTALKTPVKLTLNSRAIELKPFVGKHRLYGVTSFLSGDHNQLIVNKHPQAGDFTLWVSYEAPAI
jgi:SpoIID/LytB domain protein